MAEITYLCGWKQSVSIITQILGTKSRGHSGRKEHLHRVEFRKPSSVFRGTLLACVLPPDKLHLFRRQQQVILRLRRYDQSIRLHPRVEGYEGSRVINLALRFRFRFTALEAHESGEIVRVFAY